MFLDATWLEAFMKSQPDKIPALKAGDVAVKEVGNKSSLYAGTHFRDQTLRSNVVQEGAAQVDFAPLTVNSETQTGYRMNIQFESQKSVYGVV